METRRRPHGTAATPAALHAWRGRLAAALALLLAGCGGGSDGNGNNNSSAPPTAQGVRLAGRVVAAPVGGATVQALCHDTAPAKVVGSAVSAADGGYQVETSERCNSVFELRVSGGSYVDEASGTLTTGPAAPWLRALSAGTAGGATHTVHVTPLTELVVQQALAGSAAQPLVERTNDALRTTHDALRRFTGTDIDVVKTNPAAPAGGTAPDEAGAAYALMLAAISQLSGPAPSAIAATAAQLRADGFGRRSRLPDAMRLVTASADILRRLSLSQAAAARLVQRAESYLAVEALLPLNDVAATSALSCDPLAVLQGLQTLAEAHAQRVRPALLSPLSLALSGDSYVAALTAWRTRCPALAPTLDLMAAAEQAAADQSHAEFTTARRPLRDCANDGGVVARVIVRGTGVDVCVAWNGQDPPAAYALASLEAGAADSALSYERCVELSRQPPNLFVDEYAVFMLRGTPYLYCGRQTLGRWGFAGWLDRQNIGWYPDGSRGTTPSGARQPAPAS